MKFKTIFAIVALVGGYVLCQAIADVGATKFVEIAGIALPAGSLMFAVTFTLRDLLHKRLGVQWARAAIVCAALFNVVQALYLAGMAALPAPVYFQNAEAWAAIFSIVPAIAVASITAEVVSELVDTEVYNVWKNKLGRLPQWTRVLASNAVSLPLDSLIFGTLAFVWLPPVFGGEAYPFSVAMTMVGGQIVWKAIITVVSMPGIYLVKEEPIKVIEA